MVSYFNTNQTLNNVTSLNGSTVFYQVYVLYFRTTINNSHYDRIWYMGTVIARKQCHTILVFIKLVIKALLLRLRGIIFNLPLVLLHHDRYHHSIKFLVNPVLSRNGQLLRLIPQLVRMWIFIMRSMEYMLLYVD